MKTILSISDPNVYASYLGAPILHPLVNVIHYDEVSPVRSSLNRYGVYGLFIQKNFPKNLTKDYHFFSYFATETLKMEPAEWGRITQLLTQMRHELQENTDSPALRSLILSYIRVILEYCNRIYLRQLSKEDKTTSDILKRFHNLLREYYLDRKQMERGVPSVQYCADELAYSARYLGDVIHKATGGTAIGYIHSFVIEQGKNLMMNGHNIGETAHLLGFEYPHHFTRLFKNTTGITPSDFLRK